MTQEFHKTWLKVTAVVIASFAPIFFLGTMPATSEPARLTLDMISWPIDGSATYDHPDTRLLGALGAGFLLGWGVMIWCLATRVHDHAPEGVRISGIAGLLAWYVLDSLGSILSGNAVNALLNIPILLVAAGPLWRPATETADAP